MRVNSALLLILLAPVTLSELLFGENESEVNGFFYGLPVIENYATCGDLLDSPNPASLNLNAFYDVLSISRGFRAYSFLTDKIYLWKNNRIPTKIDLNVNVLERKKLACAVKYFHENTCVKFIKKRPYHRNYLRISKFDKRKGCFSESLGRVGGRQVLNLDPRSRICWEHGTIVHELFHVLGFYHEHSRSDRDKYIKINWENVPRKMESQFYKINEIGFRVAYEDAVGKYDYRSIMHYPQFMGKFGPLMSARKEPKWINNSAMGNRRNPSRLDTKKINRLYKCSRS